MFGFRIKHFFVMHNAARTESVPRILAHLLATLSSRHQSKQKSQSIALLNNLAKMVKEFITIIFTIPSFLLFAQSSPTTILSQKAALQDISILKTSIYEIHPSVFRYTSKNDFEQEFTRIITSLPDSLTLFQFTSLVVPVIAKIHCGHTYPVIPYIGADTKAIPLDIKIIDNKIFIVNDLSGLQYPKIGFEIIKINGRQSQEILDILRSKEVADGFVATTKDRNVEKFFKWYYAIYIDQPDTFKVDLKKYENNDTETVSIASLVDSRIEQNRGMQEKVKSMDFRMDNEHDLAVLRINSFMSNQIKKSYKQNLRKIIKMAFNDIKQNGIDNLVIDIRNNTGGMAFVPPFLYSYLGKEDFKFKDKLLFKHGYKFSHPENLNRSKLNDWFNRKLIRRVNDTTFEWTLHNNTRKTYHIKKNAFKGKLFILLNGMTASGAAEFATLVHYYKRGIFIGEESGGDYNGINGYDRTYLQLPNSKLGVLIAGYRSIMPWNESKFFGRGVPVDYEVHSNGTDLSSGRDAELEFVYNLIKR